MKSIIILRFSCLHLKTDMAPDLELHFSPSDFSPVFVHTQVRQELRGIHVNGERCDGKLPKVSTLLLLLWSWGHSEERDIDQTVQLQRAVPLTLLAHMHDDRRRCHRCDGKADSIPFSPLWENPKDQQIRMKTLLQELITDKILFSHSSPKNLKFVTCKSVISSLLYSYK